LLPSTTSTPPGASQIAARVTDDELPVAIASYRGGDADLRDPSKMGARSQALLCQASDRLIGLTYEFSQKQRERGKLKPQLAIRHRPSHLLASSE